MLQDSSKKGGRSNYIDLSTRMLFQNINRLIDVGDMPGH